MRKVSLIVLAVAAALFMTNPDKKDFENYIEAQIEKETKRNPESEEGDGSKLVEALGEILGSGVAKLAVSAVERKNYLLFSLYSFGEDEKASHMGMMGTFFKLGD
jgi:hypothetical protein